MVSNEEFARRLMGAFKTEADAIVGAIISNSPKDVEEYRYKVGVVNGLGLAMRELEDMLEAYKEANDE